MRNISKEKMKVGYSGEFKFMAIVALNMILYKKIGLLLLWYQFK